MKKLIILLLLLLFTGNCFAAELLVRAKPHWMDTLTQAEVDKMTEGEKASYNARSQVGDIIVVRPDEWEWGREECLPNFIVIKVPQINYEEAKKYEESLMDNTNPENSILLKVRKYQIPKTTVDNAKALSQNSITITKTSLTSQVVKKTK